MYLPSPSFSSPFGTDVVTSLIFTPGPKVWPPSVDLKIHSLNVVGAPLQFGSSTAIFSAETYSVPSLATIGTAPMYCPKEQPVKSGAILSAYETDHVWPPSVERATGRPRNSSPVVKSKTKSSYAT